MRIIIADREETVIEEIVRALENSGVEYKLEGTTDNSKEGYELIKTVRPDLVIMDVKLEESDGLAMMKKLRADGVISRLIILTEDRDFNTTAGEGSSEDQRETGRGESCYISIYSRKHFPGMPKRTASSGWQISQSDPGNLWFYSGGTDCCTYGMAWGRV